MLWRRRQPYNPNPNSNPNPHHSTYHGPTVASAQCYEDNRCFYTCGYGYYQHAGLV